MGYRSLSLSIRENSYNKVATLVPIPFLRSAGIIKTLKPSSILWTLSLHRDVHIRDNCGQGFHMKHRENIRVSQFVVSCVATQFNILEGFCRSGARCCLCKCRRYVRPKRLLLQQPHGIKNKQTPWPLVRERTIPTDRPQLVDEI
jgi:hypothetical protein